MTIFTSPAHYKLKGVGKCYPWPCRQDPNRRTWVDERTTLTRMDKDTYMAHEHMSIRAFVQIPDEDVKKVRDQHGDIERAIQEGGTA